MPSCVCLSGMAARRVLPILAMIATVQAFAPNLASVRRAVLARFDVSTTRMSATRPRGEQCSSHPGDGAMGIHLDGTAYPLSSTALAVQAFFLTAPASACPVAAFASRRTAIAAVASTLSILGSPVQPATAAQGAVRGEGIISRINEPTLKRVEGARLEDEDIFYPRYCQSLPPKVDLKKQREREREKKGWNRRGGREARGWGVGARASFRERGAARLRFGWNCVCRFALGDEERRALSPTFSSLSARSEGMQRAVKIKFKIGGEAATTSRAFPPLVHTTGRSAHPLECSANFASRLAGEFRRRAED